MAEASRGLLGLIVQCTRAKRRRQGCDRPHHRRSRPYQFHGAQPLRRGRTHRRRGQADRGHRLADLAARAQRHDRGGARRRRRHAASPSSPPRSRRWRSRPRRPPATSARRFSDIQQAVNKTVEAIAGVSSSVTTMSNANRQLTEILDHQAAEINRIGSRAEQVAGTVGSVLPEISTHGRQRRGSRQRRARHRRGSARPLAMAGRGGVALFLRSRIRRDQDRHHAFAVRHDDRERAAAAGTAGHADRAAECTRRTAGPAARAGHRQSAFRSKAYAALAKKLIGEHKVAAMFGCWSSASRKEVLPIVERDNALLFYPSQYEGQETSRNIFYTGATPPQQAIPAVNFLLRAGHPPVFPGRHGLHLSAHHQRRPARLSGAARRSRMSRNATRRSATTDWREIVEDIRRFAKGGRTAIVATVSGDANVHFFRELAQQK